MKTFFLIFYIDFKTDLPPRFNRLAFKYFLNKQSYLNERQLIISFLYYYIFISMSTPAGKLKLVKSSMVLAVGSIISIILLWTRISY